MKAAGSTTAEMRNCGLTEAGPVRMIQSFPMILFQGGLGKDRDALVEGLHLLSYQGSQRRLPNNT